MHDTYTHMYIYIYIYIYTEREREMYVLSAASRPGRPPARGRSRGTPPLRGARCLYEPYTSVLTLVCTAFYYDKRLMCTSCLNYDIININSIV